MRRLPIALLLLSAQAPLLAAAPTDPVAQINRTLDSLHEAAAGADGARYFALFAADAVYIGTDAAERWTLEQFKAYASPYFSKGQGWVYRPRERHVVLADIPCRCVAWFDELLDSESYGSSRGTGVLVIENGNWKVAQYALSFPLPNPLAGRITGEIKAFEAGQQTSP